METTNGVTAPEAVTPIPIPEIDARELGRILSLEMVAHGFAPRWQSRHISNHNMAERFYLARLALARAYGLPDEALKNITPYPAPPSHTTYIKNDLQPLIDLVSHFIVGKQQEPEKPAGKPAEKAEGEKPTRTANGWHSYLWPLLMSAGLAGAGAGVGGGTYYFWDDITGSDTPANIGAEMGVNIR